MESVSLGVLRQVDGGFIKMVEKFLSLSKGKQFALVAMSWLIMAGCFVGTMLLKQLENELLFAEIILTSAGMFFMVVAICLSAIYILKKED